MFFSHKNKLIALLLSVFVLVSLCSCGDDVSEDTSDAEDTLDRLAATALLERDKMITDIFVGCTLADYGSGADYSPLPEGHEYREYSRIAELLAETYVPGEGGDADFFAAYPSGLSPSVVNRDGVTYAFPHNSAVNDSINLATVEVEPTDDENIKRISAETASGVGVSLSARRVDGKWLLEKGLYRTLNKASGAPSFVLAASGHGSMKSLSGNLLVISFFISDKATSFTAEEEAAYSEKIKAAVEPLSDIAAAYGNELWVTYESAYFSHMGIVGTRPIDFDIVFAETGFGTLQSFAEQNYPVDMFDNYLFIVCLDKDAKTDYNASLGTADTEAYAAERVFVGQSSTSSEISRAVLSLLGARDFSLTEDEYLSSLYRVYFPEEIMYTDSKTGDTLSPVNAFACGLLKDLPYIYHAFLKQ